MLGGDTVFSKKTSSPSILENPKIIKVTFDCRSDSDALIHQFGVKLACWSLGSSKFWIRLSGFTMASSLPNETMFFCHSANWFLQSMETVSKRYQLDGHKSGAPHWHNSTLVLSLYSVYAAMDIVIIQELCQEMSNISDIWSTDGKSPGGTLTVPGTTSPCFAIVKIQCVIGTIRPLSWKEHGLEWGHPKRLREWLQGSGAMEPSCNTSMKKGKPSAFHHVLFVLQDDDWCSEAGLEEM